VGISNLANAKPNELSGGELRRMAIARAMLLHPEILLADEPTAGLDNENTLAVLSLLRKAADDGAAVLLVTHENEAAQFADRVYTMD
jgi:putative ABC transport system ATP-binding protein